MQPLYLGVYPKSPNVNLGHVPPPILVILLTIILTFVNTTSVLFSFYAVNIHTNVTFFRLSCTSHTFSGREFHRGHSENLRGEIRECPPTRGHSLISPRCLDSTDPIPEFGSRVQSVVANTIKINTNFAVHILSARRRAVADASRLTDDGWRQPFHLESNRLELQVRRPLVGWTARLKGVVRPAFARCIRSASFLQ